MTSFLDFHLKLPKTLLLELLLLPLERLFLLLGEIPIGLTRVLLLLLLLLLFLVEFERAGVEEPLLLPLLLFLPFTEPPLEEEFVVVTPGEEEVTTPVIVLVELTLTPDSFLT